MLTHSPPLPLFISYSLRRPLSPKDEEGALLALQIHDRVSRIHLHASPATLDRLLAVMNRPFPVLEDLTLSSEFSGAGGPDEPSYPRLPQTFQAPHLRQLDLNRVGDVTEVGLSLLASFSGLVSLMLLGIPDSMSLPLEYLVSRLSLIPNLEHLGLGFIFDTDPDDIGGELNVVPNMTRISLPNLSEIFFRGDSFYLEGLAARISSPCFKLKTFIAKFFEQPSSTLPYLSRLILAAMELRLPVASIEFSGARVVGPAVTICMTDSEFNLDQWPHFAPFQISFRCESLGMQVASAGKICPALSPMLSEVATLHLNLDSAWGFWQLGQEDGIEDARWHDLLRPFCSVDKLQVDTGLMGYLSLALCRNVNGPGPSMGILPGLRTLARPDYAHFGDAFDGFIAARRNIGRHITKCRRPAITDESDREDEMEDEEEAKPEIGVEEEESNDADSDMELDDSGTNDVLESSTELDSGSDFEAELTINVINPRLCKFALYA